MDTNWQPELNRIAGPKYLALSRALRDAVRSGHLRVGDRLPPVRDLAWRIGVTPGTVARAYQIGTQEGLLSAVVGRGTFVADAKPRLGPEQSMVYDREVDNSQGLLDLRSPQLPEVGQKGEIAAAMKRVSARIGQDWLDYPNLRLDRHTRVALLPYMADRNLGTIGSDDLVLTHGGQNAISIVLQCCLKGDRPTVLGEDLAYPGFRHAARLARAEMVPVALDGEGMRADALDAANGDFLMPLIGVLDDPFAA